MKTLAWIVICALNAGCVLASPPASKFTMRVVDAETGLPVTNAEIRVTFTEQADPWGTGVGKSDRQKTKVDKEGAATFKGNSAYPGCGGSVFADGYYSDGGGMNYQKKNSVLNRWEPWNPTIEVKMRKIKNPVPMVYEWIQRESIPVWEKPAGFDLQAGDWVSPHGDGAVADFVFTATRVTEPKEGVRYSLTFSNPLDGLQEYVPPEDIRSSYIFPYLAPTNKYVPTFNRYRLLKYPELSDYPANNLKADGEISYIFRVRTKTGRDGNIISANYGRIQGEVSMSLEGRIYFQYWFNPEPNNRSLESDKKPY